MSEKSVELNDTENLKHRWKVGRIEVNAVEK